MAQTKIKQKQIVNDGWIELEGTCSYSSATTLTIAGDFSGILQKGDKIKLTQTTDKYFYIYEVTYSAPTTTVILNGGSDYSLANASIDNPYYSRVNNPFGFPSWFAYTPTWTAATTNPAIGNGTLMGRFAINGNVVFAKMYQKMGSTSTYGVGAFLWTLPFQRAVPATISVFQRTGMCVYRDSSAVTGASGYAFMYSSGVTNNRFALSAYNSGNGMQYNIPITWAQNDELWVDLVYEI